MHFGIGRDLATVLIKAILFSMLCVFTLMPGLLVLFSKLIDKTRHKNLIPKITAVGKFDIKTRFIIPPIFGVIIVAAAVFANLCPYCYTYTDLVTAKQSERQIAYQKIKTPSVPATWWPSLCRRATMSPRAGSRRAGRLRRGQIHDGSGQH